MNKKLIIMLSLAVIIAMAVTAFPLHIEPGHNSDWPFVITIGSPVSAQESDYTCDGSDDNVQFQTALNALPSSGGQLFVLAGNYTFADSTTVTRAIDHVSIIGVSAAVSFTGDGVTAIFTAGGDGWLFSNIAADAGGLAMGATTDYMWLHVIVDSTYYPLKTDAINIEDHSALHGVGGADTIFPADPDADRLLLWDDDPGNLAWLDYSGWDVTAYTAGDALTLTGHDIDFDGGAAPGGELGGTWANPTVDSGIHDDEYVELEDTFGGDVSGTYDAIDITEAVLGVGGTDTVFPADPDADKFLMWDDDPGNLVWETIAGGGDMLKSTYDTDEDGDIDTAAGGTEWDSSAATGVAYITAGAWGTKATGITNTYILVVDGDPNDDEYARFTASGLEGRTEGEFKQDYNLEIGTDVQAYDAELAAIAGLTSAANKLIYFTGSGTADVSDLTAFARSILDDADESTFKATVNLEIGTDIAAQTHASQHDVAGADTVFPADPDADKFLMWDDDPGNLVWETIAGGGDMLKSTYDTDEDGDIDTAAGGTEWDSSAATGVAYITGGSWSAISKGIADTNFVVIDGDPNDDEYARFTANGLEGRTEAEFKADFNLEIGTDVLAYDATLSSIADLGTAADKIAYTTDVDTWAETGLTAFARSILDDADEATFKATVNLEIGTDVLAQQTIGIADDNLLEVDGDPNDDEYARFTANGLEGRTEAEFKADFNIQSNVITITFIIDGGGSAISTGEAGHLELPFACTVTGWTILADQSGSIAIDVWKDTYANFPPTVADTIAGSEKPTISAAQKGQDLTLSTWTTAVSAGDILAFNVDSCSTIERITLSIRAAKT